MRGVVLGKDGAWRSWGQLAAYARSVSGRRPPGIVLFFTAIVASAGPSCAERKQPGTATSDSALVANVMHLAEQLSRADSFSGVVLLSRRAHPLLRRAFGFADRESGRPNTIDTPFELASVSKMFTAVAVAQLVERKRLRLEATIGSLLPDYPAGPSASTVTVEHLLTMSSGIPDVFRSQRFWAALGGSGITKLSDCWSFFAKEPLEFSPGTRWSYSNSNFLVLGAIVQQVTGNAFTAVVEHDVFRRAGLTHTSYHVYAFPDRARGYTRSGPGTSPSSADSNKWHPTLETRGPERDFMVAMGGGVSTADDLARFGEALMRGRLLGEDMAERVMRGYVPTGYGGRDGYGFETLLLNGVRIVGHRGGFTGISNQVDFYPDVGYVLVVLGNTDAGSTEAIVNRVRGLITGSSAPVQSTGTAP